MAGRRRVSRQEKQGRTHGSSYTGGTGEDAYKFFFRRNKAGSRRVSKQKEQDRTEEIFLTRGAGQDSVPDQRVQGRTQKSF